MEVILVLLALWLIVHLISKIDVDESSSSTRRKSRNDYKYVDGPFWVQNNKKQRKSDKEFDDDSSYDGGLPWVRNNRKRRR